jgi:hypothetical protein
MRMWRFVLGASFLGAGAVAVACSSSSSSSSPAGDDASADAPSSEDAGGAEAAACVANSMSVATLDGGATWGCIQAACDSMGLSACAADCVCNNAILSALACVQTMGAANTMSCFTTALTAAESDTAVQGLLSCLEAKSASCGGPAIDGGEAGTTSHDGGEAGTSEAGTSEGGGEEAGPSEAGTEAGTPDASDAGNG